MFPVCEIRNQPYLHYLKAIFTYSFSFLYYVPTSYMFLLFSFRAYLYNSSRVVFPALYVKSETNLISTTLRVKQNGAGASRAYVHNVPRTGCPPSTCSLRLEARREKRTVCHLSSATFVPASRFWKQWELVYSTVVVSDTWRPILYSPLSCSH